MYIDNNILQTINDEAKNSVHRRKVVATFNLYFCHLC